MPAAGVENNAALYTTWDEEWRGRSEYRTETGVMTLSSKASQRLLEDYRSQREAARSPDGANGTRTISHNSMRQDDGMMLGQHTEDVLEAAEAAIEQGVYDEAISVLTNAIDDGDETPVLFHLRGCAWLKSQEPERALEDLNTCLRLEPWFPEAYVERGHCYQALHDFPNAVKEFIKATKIMPDPEANLYFELGDCSAATQDNESAAKFFASAVKIAPDYALAHWRLADVKAALGDAEGAAESYAMVCQMDPQVNKRYLNIAQEDYEAGKFEEALRTLQAVEKISPQDFRVFWQRANCRMELEDPDWEGALADLSRCIEIDPVREIEAYIRRGRCLMRLEKFEAARSDAEHYLKLLESQEDAAGSDAAFEGRLLRAHLYMLEVRAAGPTAALNPTLDFLKSIKRAVMDYDYVVNTYNPPVAKVRKMYPEAHYCIARLIPHAPEFPESLELAAEATERFQKAWSEGVHEPLRHCSELVVAEKRLKDIRQEEAAANCEEEAKEADALGPNSLRSMCAVELTKKGKYGGKSLPGHFHLRIAEMLSKEIIPEGGAPVTQADWQRCARHVTLAWKNGAQMDKTVGFSTHCVYMGRRKLDADGAVIAQDVGALPLTSLCVDAIAGNEELFPSTLPWMTTLRETAGGGGGKKKK